jgi:hypothetical protein
MSASRSRTSRPGRRDGHAIDLSTFPGVNNYLATDGNDTLTFELGYPKIVYDQGGNDIYTVDMNDVVPGSGILTIRETAEASSTDTLKLENIDAGDVGVFKTLNGNDLVITANGQVVGWVPGQYSGAHPLLNAVEVHPSLGSPTTIPLNDPATIPFFFPEDVPGFTPSALSAFGVAEGQTSPLVLDLDGDGVELTDHDGATTTTFFDIDADGFAEQTAWVEADDGLLAIDTNDNGIVIDDASEPFGTATIDGFAKLAELDSNGDLIFDANDAAWNDLLIWNDANQDAQPERRARGPERLQHRQHRSCRGITFRKPYQGTRSATSSFKYANGTTGDILDAWLVHDNVNTQYVGDYSLSDRALSLPTLRGLGELPDLVISMSQDEDLLEMVEDFALNWTSPALLTNRPSTAPLKISCSPGPGWTA